MNFEVIFRLNGKELARSQFPVETPADFEAGIMYALQTLRIHKPEIDLLGDGMLMLVHKAGQDDAERTS
jgi:hypothetical protein